MKLAMKTYSNVGINVIGIRWRQIYSSLWPSGIDSRLGRNRL